MVSTFISYSRADSPFAIRLAKDLKSAGFDVWLDQLDIATGTRWDDEVEIALESCKTFMIVLSPESLQSQNVKDEIGYAIDSGKDILPLKIKSGEIPFRLRRFQYVDFSKQSYNESLKEIKSLLSLASPSLPAKQVEKETVETDAEDTLRRIKAIAPAPLPDVSKPTLKKPRATLPRSLLVAIAAVGILAVAGILIRTLAAQRSSSPPPAEEVPVTGAFPTEQSTAESTPDTGPVSTPTEPGPPAAFQVNFNGSSGLGDWEDSVLGTGRRSKAEISPSNDGLLFHLDDPDLRAYYIYQPANYGDVVIRMKAENLGQNTYQVSLVCRKAEGTWYEYMIIGGGLWQLFDYSGKYNSLDNGGTFTLNPGKSVNEYEMRCIGNEISLRINGEEVNTYPVRQNVYPEGQVGLSISSGTVFPIDMKVLDFEVSSQSSASASAGDTSFPTARSPAGPGSASTRIAQKDGMTMVFVPAGEFTMGSEEGEPNESPTHTVFVDSFWIDQTEITNRMYAAFLNAQGAQSAAILEWLDVEDNDLHVHLVDETWQVDPGYENHPVIEMRWLGAAAYCEWRGEGTRLPTEAEWEKAARGTTENLYPWGNEIGCNLANYGECVGGTVAVGSYPANVSPYGALDMTGNVMEWVADWYSEDYYQSSPTSNPQGPDSGQHRVIKGGSWDGHTEYQARLTFRFLEAPDESKDDAGFRCVMPE